MGMSAENPYKSHHLNSGQNRFQAGCQGAGFVVAELD
jgi:hypothetical protein